MWECWQVIGAGATTVEGTATRAIEADYLVENTRLLVKPGACLGLEKVSVIKSGCYVGPLTLSLSFFRRFFFRTGGAFSSTSAA